MEYNGCVFFRANMSKIHEQLPMLSEKNDTIYRYIKKLISIGILEKVPKLDYYRITSLGLEYEFSKGQSEPSEINPTPIGNKSDTPSEINPTYNSTHINNPTEDNKKDIIYFSNPEVDFVFKEFLQDRKKRKKVATEKAVKMLIKVLEPFKDNPAMQIKMIENSIRSAWTDIYPLKPEHVKPGFIKNDA